MLEEKLHRPTITADDCVEGGIPSNVHEQGKPGHATSREQQLGLSMYSGTIMDGRHLQGIGILGPFPKAVVGYEWLYMAINKFTK